MCCGFIFIDFGDGTKTDSTFSVEPLARTAAGRGAVKSLDISSVHLDWWPKQLQALKLLVVAIYTLTISVSHE